MPDLIVTGSVGLDTVTTPFGKRAEQIGGSATYAALAASKFARVGMVSIVGVDFNADTLSWLASQVDTEGVEISGKTLRWTAKYEYTMEEAETLDTKLNNIVDYVPELPEHFASVPFHLLANLDPDKQLKVIEQIKSPQHFIAADTMNFWIANKKDSVIKVLKHINLLVLNEGEARQLFATPNLIKAGHAALSLGPEFVIIKKGEHGALLFSNRGLFSIGGYPLETVTDPTGAGDSFAGALMGFLANQYQEAANLSINEPMVRKGLVTASAVASFTAEGFGPEILTKATINDIKERYDVFKQLHQF